MKFKVIFKHKQETYSVFVVANNQDVAYNLATIKIAHEFDWNRTEIVSIKEVK